MDTTPSPSPSPSPALPLPRQRRLPPSAMPQARAARYLKNRAKAQERAKLYYEKNRETVLQIRAEHYKTSSEYRESTKKRALARYYRALENKECA